MDKIKEEDTENKIYRWIKSYKEFLLFGIFFIVTILMVKTPFFKKNFLYSMEYIKGLGNVGIILFIIGSSVINLVTNNSTITNLASGLLYGFTNGCIITIINIYITGIVSYFIGKKYMAKDVNKKLNEDKSLHMFKEIRDNSQSFTPLQKIEFAVLSRIPPVYPFIFISYFWGILDLEMKYFLIGILGAIPAVILETFIGSNLDSFDKFFNNKHSLNIFIITIVLSIIITIFIGYLAKKTIHKNVKKLKKKI